MGRHKDSVWKHAEKLDMNRFKCKFCKVVYGGGATRIKSHLSSVVGRGIKLCPEVPRRVQQKVTREIGGARRKRKVLSTSSDDEDNSIDSTSSHNQNNEVGIQARGNEVGSPMVQAVETMELVEGEEDRRIVEVHNPDQQVGKVPIKVQREATRAIEKRKVLASLFGDEDSNIHSSTSSQARGDEDGRMVGVHSPEQQVERDNDIGDSVETRGNEDGTMKLVGDNEDGTQMESHKAGSQARGKEEGMPIESHEIGNQARGDEDGSPVEVHSIEQQIEEGNVMDINIGESVESVETRGTELRTTKLVGEAFQRNIDKIWAWLVNDDVSSIGICGMAGVGKTELAKHINNKLLKDSNQFHHIYWFDVPGNVASSELQNNIAKKVGLHLSAEIGETERAAKLLEALRNGKFVLILDDVLNDIDLDKVGIPVGENGCKVVLTTRSFDVCRVIACQKTIKVECLGIKEDWYLFKEILGCQTTLSVEVEMIARDVVHECEGLPLALVTLAKRMRAVVDIYEWRNALNKLKGPTPMQDNMDVFEKLKVSYDRLNNSAMQQCFLYCALFPRYVDGFFRENLIDYLIVEGIIERKRSRQQEIDEGHVMLNRLENVCLLAEIDKGVKMHKWIRKMALQIQSPKVMVETEEQLDELLDETSWTENLLRVAVFNTDIKEIPSNLSPSCPNLSTLLLVENPKLNLIPDSFFQKLSGLKVLDFSDTLVEALPDSLFNLVGLVALLLRGCYRLRHVPSLANLRELEKLDMSNSGVEEVPDGMELLSKLRYLDLDGTELREFPTGILPNLPCLQFLKLDRSVSLLEVELKCLRKLETLQCGLDKCGSDLRLPLLNKCNILIGLQELMLRNWAEDFINLKYNIKNLVMENCGVRSLSFTSVDELEVLLRRPSIDSFVFLKNIKINNCSSIKYLFTPLLASNLKGLEEIEVSNCSQVEEIIAATEHEEEGTRGDAISNIEIAFPNLRTLDLRNLKELKSIYNGKIICNSIQYISVYHCEKLKRMPLSLVSLNQRMSPSLSLNDKTQPSPPPLLRQISVCSRKWWGSLEWDHPNAMNVLQSYVRFSN